MIRYIKYAVILCVLAVSVCLTACSDEDDKMPPLSEGQGEVVFGFMKNTVYNMYNSKSEMENIARVKVTLKKDDKLIVLDPLDLDGTKDSLATIPYRLDVGSYQLVNYILYDHKGNLLEDIDLREDNEFIIEHGTLAKFYFPVDVKKVFIQNTIKNTLLGICNEVFGADSTLWPKTWRPTNEDLADWENLEFQEDDFGNIMYLAGVTFDKKFKGMKKLPAAIGNLITLESIVIMDIPEFEELPEELSNITGLSALLVANTSFKEFPRKIERITNLEALSVINSNLTEIPARLGSLEKLKALYLWGNKIASLPDEICNLPKLDQLTIYDTEISTLPAELFTKLSKVSTFDLRNNKKLSTLPAGQKTGRMRGLLLDGCSFTSIPDAVKQTPKLRLLSMTDNQLSTISATDFVNNKELTDLMFDGNRLSSFPALQMDTLQLLSLNNCGLNQLPDLSGLRTLLQFEAGKNSFNTIPENYFVHNLKMSNVNLSDNVNLRSLPVDMGFFMREQTDKINGVPVSVNKPYYLTSVNVDNCPNLVWEVPSSWCCIRNYMANELQLDDRNVVIYHDNSPGVTRARCPVCGKSHIEAPRTLAISPANGAKEAIASFRTSANK